MLILFGASNGPNYRKEEIMKNDNRVLARSQARELTEKETEKVTGGIHTETVCTFNGTSVDGDVGEC